MVNFGEVQRAQLTKTTLLTSTLGPWDLFRTFKVCSDADVRKAMGIYRIYSIPGKTATLVPEFAVEELPLGGGTAA